LASVDLNADLGEEILGGEHDASMLECVTSASVACGFHAGDPGTMHRTISEAVSRGVVVGAHPSYADRSGFGRRHVEVEPERLTDELLYQIGGLDALARAVGTRIRFVKPHGALYNEMAHDEDHAAAVCKAIAGFEDLVLLAPAGSVSLRVAESFGIRSAPEVFADRSYLPDGRLAPRTMHGAVITDTDEVARRAVMLATRGTATTVDGDAIELRGHSICIHGDTPGSVRTARAVRSALEGAGLAVEPFVR
jgi:UPF0271 protein